ncbi:MAG: DUF4830 domain-containing protein [Clostridia bacterium]|nr:DUF4830 domain-containing protein [Clostridia bacterium]
MFIYSIKASSLKFFTALGIAAAVLITIVFSLPSNGSITAGSIFVNDGEIRYDKIKTEDARIKFIEQFGWTVETPAMEEVEIKIPSDFDKIMNSYNDIQKAQGLDLSKYKGKTVTRYTYKVTNYPDYNGTVFANIIICKNKVIGGDICSSDIEGFIHGFERPATESESAQNTP